MFLHTVIGTKALVKLNPAFSPCFANDWCSIIFVDRLSEGASKHTGAQTEVQDSGRCPCMALFAISYQACSWLKILALQSSTHEWSRQPAQAAYGGWRQDTFGKK